MKVKLNDNLIEPFMKQFDVIFFSETRTDENSQIDLEGFLYIHLLKIYPPPPLAKRHSVCNYSKRYLYSEIWVMLYFGLF